MGKEPTMQINFRARDAATNGPRKAEVWRNTMRELSMDLSQLATYWNTYIIPVLKKLPDGTGTTLQKQDDFGDDLNVFNDALDGSQIFIDWDTDSSEESGLFWNSTRDRPYTIKEEVKNLKDMLDSVEQNLIDLINENGSGITTDQKSAIGDRIFTGGTSSPDSLDGMINTNTNNIKYLKRDIYDDANRDLASALTNTIKDILNTLLGLHGVSDWQDSLSGASHSAIDIDTLSGSLDPDKVRSTSVDHSGDTGYPDNYASLGSTLDTELGRIKTIIRNIKGLAAGNWESSISSALPKKTSGYATNIYEILNDVAGTGTQSSTNPWGYKAEDIDDLYTDVVETATSGVYTTDNNQPYSTLQENLNWMCNPADSGVTTDNTFRRMKQEFFNLANGSTYDITHSKGAWPIVQVFEYSDTYGTWIQADVTILQENINTVGIYNGSGATINSGIAILLW